MCLQPAHMMLTVSLTPLDHNRPSSQGSTCSWLAGTAFKLCSQPLCVEGAGFESWLQFVHDARCPVNTSTLPMKASMQCRDTPDWHPHPLSPQGRTPVQAGIGGTVCLLTRHPAVCCCWGPCVAAAASGECGKYAPLVYPSFGASQVFVFHGDAGVCGCVRGVWVLLLTCD
jgi:hypothetical protein